MANDGGVSRVSESEKKPKKGSQTAIATYFHIELFGGSPVGFVSPVIDGKAGELGVGEVWMRSRVCV